MIEKLGAPYGTEANQEKQAFSIEVWVNVPHCFLIPFLKPPQSFLALTIAVDLEVVSLGINHAKKYYYRTSLSHARTTPQSE
jgi:hypothetical protein